MTTDPSPPSPAAPNPPPVRRAYAPIEKSKDVDSFERATRLQLLGWSAVGAVMGGMLGVFMVARGGSILLLPVGAIGGWGAVMLVPRLVAGGAGKVGEMIHNPSGRSTPRKKEYSYAESLVARGLIDEAVAAFEEAIAEDATDPMPYLRIARLARDRLGDDERAARWFQRAATESEINSGLLLLCMRELVELCEGRLGAPKRAAPMLARVASERPGTEAGEWAAETLRRIKEGMAAEPDGV